MWDHRWIRGAVTLGVLGALAAAMIASPVGAAFNPTKKKVKNIAKKQANAVFNSNIGPALVPEQDVCADGAVHGFAYIDGGALGGGLDTMGVLHAFNCTGGSVEAGRDGPGAYNVRFSGLTSMSADPAVVSLSTGTDSATSASYAASSAVLDYLELTVRDMDGVPVDDEVSVVIFNARA